MTSPTQSGGVGDLSLEYQCEFCRKEFSEGCDLEHCDECGNLIWSISAIRRRERMRAEAVDDAFDRYHAGRTAHVEAPSLSIGTLTRKQAG